MAAKKIWVFNYSSNSLLINGTTVRSGSNSMIDSTSDIVIASENSCIHLFIENGKISFESDSTDTADIVFSFSKRTKRLNVPQLLIYDNDEELSVI